MNLWDNFFKKRLFLVYSFGNALLNRYYLFQSLTLCKATGPTKGALSSFISQLTKKYSKLSYNMELNLVLYFFGFKVQLHDFDPIFFQAELGSRMAFVTLTLPSIRSIDYSYGNIMQAAYSPTSRNTQNITATIKSVDAITADCNNSNSQFMPVYLGGQRQA